MADPTNLDKLNGSLLIVEAESVAAVRAVLEQDKYWTQNVVRTTAPSLPRSSQLLFLDFGMSDLFFFYTLAWKPYLGIVVE